MTKWICHPEDRKDNYLVPVFRRRFELHQKVKKAVLRLSAHGLYEVQVNSAGVTENRFMPGLTSYYYRIQMQEYDITALFTDVR